MNNLIKFDYFNSNLFKLFVPSIIVSFNLFLKTFLSEFGDSPVLKDSMKISSSVLAIGLLAAAAKASPVGNENLTKKAVGELVRGVNLG